MITYNNLYNNNNMKETASLGCVKVFEHHHDLSVNPSTQTPGLIELNGNAFTYA